MLDKDLTLTDVDKLSFLQMTIKCEEGKEIIDSHTRRGSDFNAAVKALKERYDQPRVTSRTIHQSFIKHNWKLTNEGIGQLITLIQRTVATMKFNVPLEIPKHLIDKSPINSQLRRRLRIITTPLRLTEIHSSPKFSWESAKLLSNLEDDFRKHELYLIVVHICPL